VTVREIPDMEVHEAEDWAALYVDGKLDRVGDAYLADERIREIVGVRTVQDDAFMRGQGGRDGVAQTVAEVEAYARERRERQERAAALRAEAARLEAEAAGLAGGAR
jgi:hypothetical protein